MEEKAMQTQSLTVDKLKENIKVRNIKYGNIEKVLNIGIMKQGTEWVDCVIYQGEDRFGGGTKIFVKRTEDFLNEFEIQNENATN